jgi:hypothetical protein
MLKHIVLATMFMVASTGAALACQRGRQRVAPRAPARLSVRGTNVNTNINSNAIGRGRGHREAGPRSVSVRGLNNNTNINTNVLHLDLGLAAWGNAVTAYWNAVGAFWAPRHARQR